MKLLACLTVLEILERIIKGTKVIAVIKTMQSSDKDQTWKIYIHNKEHKVTKTIHTKQQKQMGNSDTKNWEHGPGAPVG